MVRGIACVMTGVLSGAWYCVCDDRCTQWCVVLCVYDDRCTQWCVVLCVC